MTQTMRERLIEVAEDELMTCIGPEGGSPRHCAELCVDAILAELREPDEGMANAGAWVTGLADTAFTVMIDHVRSQR